MIEEIHRQAKIEFLLGIGELALDTVEHRRVFGIGIGFGIEFFDDDLAAARMLELTEQVFNALGKGLQTHRHGAALRKIKANFDRRFELGQYRLGARRQRVHAALRQIGADVESADDEVSGYQYHNQRRHAASGIEQ